MPKEIGVTLKFITPAFIGGAENQTVSEFRLPSLKGLLRFWWRAYHHFPTEAELYKEESNIFGDTSRRASFSVVLGQPLIDLTQSSGTKAFKVDKSGVKYLFYSTYEMGRSPGRTNWLPEGSKVQLYFRFFNEESCKEALTALWWLENFGGFGARSRRGAGSFQITEIGPLEGIEGIPRFMCQGWQPGRGDLKKEIDAFLRAGIQASCPSVGAQLPRYTAFRDGFSEYRVLTGHRSWQDWKEAADHIGMTLSKFPSPGRPPRGARFQNEARAIHSFGASGNYSSTGPASLERAAFGLPTQYRFRDGVVVQASGVEHDRRASPLLIKIGKLLNQQNYYVVVLFLWSEFLPDDEKIRLEISTGAHKGSDHKLRQPDRSTIKKFLNTL